MSKLTETFARKAPHSASGTRKHWDSEIKGLGFFVGKTAKTWYFQRDVDGQTRRVLIGRYPVISAAAARQAAQSLTVDMSRGVGKIYQTGAPTLEAAIETYLARPKLRSERGKIDLRGQLHRHLRDWLRLPLDQITKGMVVARHADLRAIPSAANHALRQFRSVWNHARRTHDLPEAPTLAIECYREEPDGRIIDDLPEWRRVVDALDNPIHATYYRLLLFTGFRKPEALAPRWRDVDPDHLHLPITENGRPFDLPILDLHHERLEPMRRLSKEWVFPTPNARSNHLQWTKRIDWSLHAHRRTFATVAMEAGVLEEIGGRLLNHTPISITGRRYTRPSLDALRPAMQVACDELVQRIQRPTRGV